MSLKREVLKVFKSLHRTRKNVFDGDRVALEKARAKINEEFKRNKHVTDTQAVAELVKYTEEVETELRTCVIQAEEIKPGIFQAKITPETLKLDNVPFTDNPCVQKAAKTRNKCKEG